LFGLNRGTRFLRKRPLPPGICSATLSKAVELSTLFPPSGIDMAEQKGIGRRPAIGTFPLRQISQYRDRVAHLTLLNRDDFTKVFSATSLLTIR
jgi:hypothetical protein